MNIISLRNVNWRLWSYFTNTSLRVKQEPKNASAPRRQQAIPIQVALRIMCKEITTIQTIKKKPSYCYSCHLLGCPFQYGFFQGSNKAWTPALYCRVIFWPGILIPFILESLSSRKKKKKWRKRETWVLVSSYKNPTWRPATSRTISPLWSSFLELLWTTSGIYRMLLLR